METNADRLKIAVVGGGVAGISASWLLSSRHDVTLIEADDRIGGHTNTITVDEGSSTVPVDTGFIVCNKRNYPNFYRLLDEWGIERRDSDMSFGFSCERSGFGYVGPSLREFSRYRKNLFNPRFLSLFFSRRRFARKAMASLSRGDLGNTSLGSYLDAIGMDDFFVHNYLIPLAASVWSSPDKDMLEFPAETFLRFFHNHGMIQVHDIPQWQTVVGGSRAYVDRFIELFPGTIMKNSPVQSVRRIDNGVVVDVQGGAVMGFDHVVLATHADLSLGMLADPSSEELSALGSWRYHHSSVVLHSDASVMPADRRLWASWNYRRPAGAEPGDPVPITYCMNRLQGLGGKRDYLVSLNLQKPVHPDSVIYSVDYSHPAYTPTSLQSQHAIKKLDGARNTHFCGSYMGYGFHEDAVASAFEVARRLECVQ